MVEQKSGDGRLAGRGKGQPDIVSGRGAKEDARGSPSLLFIYDLSSCLSLCLSGVCLAPSPPLELSNRLE